MTRRSDLVAANSFAVYTAEADAPHLLPFVVVGVIFASVGLASASVFDLIHRQFEGIKLY